MKKFVESILNKDQKSFAEGFSRLIHSKALEQSAELYPTNLDEAVYAAASRSGNHIRIHAMHTSEDQADAHVEALKKKRLPGRHETMTQTEINRHEALGGTVSK